MVKKNKKLFLIPTPISEDYTITPVTKEAVDLLHHFVVENVKTARRVLRKYNYNKNFDEEVSFCEIDKHASSQDMTVVSQWMSQGIDIGLMSEAGMPCIADPGNEYVKIAHQYNYNVIPLVGPSSILMGLITSGFNGQNFAFNGYLPIDKAEQLKALKQLEGKVFGENQTQIFIETPYRNRALYDTIINKLNPNIMLSLAINIGSNNATILSKSVKDWGKMPEPNFHKIPTVFLLGK